MRRGSARPTFLFASFDPALQPRALARPILPTMSSLCVFCLCALRRLCVSWPKVGGLDDLEMGAGDAGPGAAGVELEIALPVPDRLAVAAVARERAGEVEVSVGVVRRELESPAIVGDRIVDRAAVLVQGAQVVGGLAALRILLERRLIRVVGLVVAAHAVQQQSQ